MRVLPAALLVTLALAGPVAAQPPEGAGPVRAARLSSPVVIDGRLDEAVWRGAPSVTRFTQRDPVEGGTPSESTWVWVAFDDRALYVAARLWDSRPDSVVAQLVRRDVSTASDRFFLYLDTYHDRRSGYYFGVNAAGVLLDGTLFNDVQSDASWDGVWDARVRREGAQGAAGAGASGEGGCGPGWTIEMRIPISQMRSRAGAEQVWGINFKRCITRRNEVDYLVPLPKKASGFVSRFPELIGFEPGRRGRNVELLPYSTGKAEYLVHEAGDPFHDGSRYTPGIGADLRAGVGNNLTLNATVNPDFGQVEVDPAVVNLSDVESYFEEKRPFFTENARIFSFGQEGADAYWSLGWPAPRFFYSRRIGRAPQGDRRAARFRDVPLATHILGAAKLTGKPFEGFDFGTLQAVTSREDARYQSDGLESRSAVEPLTYYGVVRGLKQMKGGANGLGVMTTLAQRRLGNDDLADAMNHQSLMAGLDGWHFLDRKKLWVLSGWAGMSRVAGTEQRMIDLQRSSLHYLQRPDARQLGVDSSATSLTGYGARLWLNKQEGNVLFNSAVGMLSPKFDVSDVGYMSQADATNGHSGIGYKWTEPNAWRKDMSVVGILAVTGNRDGDLTSKGVYLNPTITFANDWTVNAEVFPFLSAKNDRRARGGPLMFEPASCWWQFSFDSDPSRRTTWHLVTSGSGAPSVNTSYWSIAPSVEWKPASNFTLSLGPGLDRALEDAQYVPLSRASAAAPGAVPADFGGRRYVFARLDQTTVSANLRLDVSFTRNLTLQTYVQPLIAAGRYGDFKELARAGSYEFIHYGRDHGSTCDPAYDPEIGEYAVVDPDGPGPVPWFVLPDPSFNLKSLRGNAVLRWEYRPGSVLYFVWTQERSDFEPLGELRFGPSTRRLFDAQANDIFLVKATYHLDL
jgi:hypothetical protein